MRTAALVSLPVVFVAEFGDKSQLTTMTNALRHRRWVVLSRVGIASVLVHGLSVAIDYFLGLALPERPIAVGAVLHKRLPEHFLHGLASVLFLLFEGATTAVAVAAQPRLRWSSSRKGREHSLAPPALNRRLIRVGPRLATVGRTNDQVPTAAPLSGVTCRGAGRRA
ncbi:MAG TPA: TMEM165/GDT1 family protein [Mycobacterium sp.]|nr:TMEM165/GDT1 family protein [Mycobacterium sp.]